jgi:HAD superfamily hydrolase (TIGR01509 family)
MIPALVIFDCDGVLVDSETIANRVMTEAINAAGVSITCEECRARFVGGTLQRVIDTVEEWRGKPLPAGWRESFEARRNEAFREELQAVAGVEQVLKTLQEYSVPFCVASSGSRKKMDLTLALTRLRPYFGDRIFSAAMVAQGKPAPDLFLHAAEQMGQQPENCAVVEDSLLGVSAGVAAGMRVLGYTAESDADSLKAAGAQPFDSMAELPGLIGITAEVAAD